MESVKEAHIERASPGSIVEEPRIGRDFIRKVIREP
jgi:hypothetical protein